MLLLNYLKNSALEKVSVIFQCSEFSLVTLCHGYK